MFGRDRRSDDPDADFEKRRQNMVDDLLERRRISRSSTERALREVPRHEFVPESRRSEGYADRPLPIGDDQTISAPHMVGIMVDELALDREETVLEIGTGCGYHAAVTAELVGPENVYSVEYSEQLARDARQNLERLGYGDISVRQGNGRNGWPEHASYDAAYLTCASSDFPSEVVEQVRVGGRVLAPIGRDRQTLVRATRRSANSLDREDRGGVRFVRMRG